MEWGFGKTRGKDGEGEEGKKKGEKAIEERSERKGRPGGGGLTEKRGEEEWTWKQFNAGKTWKGEV